MKKSIILVALTAILAFSSCIKDEKPSDYNFKPMYTANMTGEERKAVFDDKVAFFKTHEYFKEQTVRCYHGKYSDAIYLAYQDFIKACNEIGDAPVSDDLLEDEVFRVILICVESGEVVSYVDWTKDYWQKTE